MARKSFPLLVVIGVFLGVAVPARAREAGPGDWPGPRGPARTGLSTEKGLLQEWPKGGPKLLWKVQGLGGGYSTPSVAGGRIYLMGAKGRDEYLIALDLKDGKRLWEIAVGTTAGGFPGPRSTPTVDGDLLYVLSSDGKLVCAETAGGKVRWRKDLKADFAGHAGNWAYTESPLIDGDALVCTPGGDQATLVALNKKSGEVIWKAPVTGLKAPAGGRGGRFGGAGGGRGGRGGRFGGGGKSYNTAAYSSVVAADLGGVKQYVQFLTGGVVGVSAKDGKLLWHYDHPSSGGANCATPLVQDGSVFAASAYGTGGGRAKIVKDGDGFKAEEVYFVRQLQNHHGGMVLVGDHIYGTGANTLLCVDYKTGKVAWQERAVGKGSVAFADGRLYVRGERGTVALVEATPTGYHEKGRFDQPDHGSHNAWSHPVIAGGKLYLRDWDVLLCYDVKAK